MQSSLEREESSETSSGGRFSRFVPSVRLFSPRDFAVALLLSFVGVVAGGMFGGVIPLPLVGSVGGLVGLFVVAFAIGLVRSRRQYLEVGVAGALAATATFLLSTLSSAFLPVGVSVLQDYGVTIAGVGVGAGLLVALVGHYFGRDLRAGLTKDV